jgi:hypothetical protein
MQTHKHAETMNKYSSLKCTIFRYERKKKRKQKRGRKKPNKKNLSWMRTRNSLPGINLACVYLALTFGAIDLRNIQKSKLLPETRAEEEEKRVRT